MTNPRPDSLDAWLRRIEQLHPSEIDLGLDRVRQVHGRLGLRSDIETAITVAGTNGKGSCVAYLESIYAAAGFRPGVYTSPHLQQFNERIRIGGTPVADADIVAAFDRVEEARRNVGLTYFEFATLAALSLFQAEQVDVHVLEVGMGGRLDAVNIVNAAVSVITSIGLDHQGWLGDDRDAIAGEKAGVFRNGQPAVIGDTDPPGSIARIATQTGARLLQIGRDFEFKRHSDCWDWQGSVTRYSGLPLPRFGGDEQFANASCALAAIEQMAMHLRTDGQQIVEGVQSAQLPGRLHRIDGQHKWILDVAHNGEAALVLANSIRGFSGKTVAVIGMMDDKPVEAFGRALNQLVHEWIVVSDSHGRSLPVADFVARLAGCVDAPVHSATTVTGGLAAAAQRATAADRILVTGSFRVVGPALDYLSRHA